MSTSTWQGLWRGPGVQPKPDARDERPGSAARAPREGQGGDTELPRRPGSLPGGNGRRGWRRGRRAGPGGQRRRDVAPATLWAGRCPSPAKPPNCSG